MLLRHAKSAWPDGVEDHERPLDARGRKAAPAMGRFMAAQGLVPDLAIVSTARRAGETWALVRAGFPRKVAQRREKRIYEASPDAILAVVRETPARARTLLVVGHNPGFEDLAQKLAGAGDRSALARLRRKYPTAGLAVIDFGVERWSEVTDGGGRLALFETPKRLAGRVAPR